MVTNKAAHVLKTRFARYALAVAAVVVATGGRLLLAPELGSRMPFVTYYVAVMFIAWYGRLGPTLLTIALSTPVAAYFFVPGGNTLLFTGTADLFGLAFFVLLGVSNAVLSEALHRTALRAEDIAARHGRAEEDASLLAAIVESSEDAIFGKTLDGIIVSWNAGAERIYGYTADEMKGRPVSVLAPTDRVDEIPAILDRLRRGEFIHQLETVRVRKDGAHINVALTISPVRDSEGKVRGASTIARDITEHKRAEGTERFLAEASKLLSSSLDYEATLANLADLIVPGLADWCAIHFVSEDGQTRQLAVTHADPKKVEWARQFERIYPYDPDAHTGVPNVLRTGKPEFYPDIPDEVLVASARSEEHLKVIRELGVRSALIVPMIARGRTLGAMTMVMAESNRRYDNTDLGLAENLAGRAALAVDNARLYREAQQARSRLAFVAEASGVLASSLDYSATLESVVRLALPELADWCIVDVVQPDGQINRVTVAAASPDKEAALRELQERYPPTWDSPQPAARALRAGETLIINRLDATAIASMTHDREHFDIMQRLSPHSIIVVPLKARARTLGAITFAVTDPDREYSMDDLALAEELAHRAALAVANARLYGEAQLAISEREEALRLRDELLKREKAAREQAETANRAKDEFLATVSHELRTPLNAILGWAHMLRSNELDQETHSRALETIERNARSQAQLIEDILDVSRIITGKLRLDAQPVELLPVIEAAVDAVRPAADAKEIRVKTILDPRTSAVTGDPNRLQQVVWNLASNAVKFTPKGGTVQVRLERAGSHVEITVSDTGQGISQEFLPHVFDRFRQADASSTRRHGGLGLGLAIVRHLVEMHGGTVEAESAGDGFGATFTVSLPVLGVKPERPGAARAHPTRDASAFVRPSQNLDGVAVMVVDDEPDTREMLKIMVGKFGATVRAFASSDEAIAALKDWRPDVIISDIEMPGEDGYSFIGRVRKLEADSGAQTPAVALTAYARTEDRLRSLSAGYQMHVAKPVDPSELVMIILSLVSRGGRGRSM